jgi:hypothetical protein
MVTIFYDISPVLRSRIIFIPLSVPEPSVPEPELHRVMAPATPYGSGSATLYLTKVNKQHFTNENVPTTPVQVPTRWNRNRIVLRLRTQSRN